jgi:hypothetical protein
MEKLEAWFYSEESQKEEHMRHIHVYIVSQRTTEFLLQQLLDIDICFKCPVFSVVLGHY